MQENIYGCNKELHISRMKFECFNFVSRHCQLAAGSAAISGKHLASDCQLIY
jgi:hypothetical protein